MMLLDLAGLSCAPTAWPEAVHAWRNSIHERVADRSLVVLEVAGRDSIAAAILLGKSNGSMLFLPTVAPAPTELGDVDVAIEQARLVLRSQLVPQALLPWLVVRDYRLWRVLNGRYIPTLIESFGLYSPCIGCHVYVHALRIVVARVVGARTVVSGERLSHDGHEKINQTEVSMAAHRRLFESSGVELVTPLLNVRETRAVAEALGSGTEYAKGSELKCVFSSAIRDARNASALIDRLEAYYDVFALPAAMAYLDWIQACWDKSAHDSGTQALFQYIDERIGV